MTNHITERYLQVGLPATLPEEQRRAWEDYLAGRAVMTRLLPTNGDRCAEPTLGGSPACGYPVLIDGACVNASEHVSWWCRKLVQRPLPQTGVGFCELKAGHEGPCEPELADEEDEDHCGGPVYSKFIGGGYNGIEGQCCLEPGHEPPCEC